MSDTTFIYALCEPDTRAIRYIGKSNDPQKRFLGHLREAGRKISYKANWIFSLLSQELEPRLLILKEVPVSDWEDWERCYIRNAKMLGFRLTNFTEGGDGVSLPGGLNPCAGKFGPAHPAFGRKVSEQEREETRKRFAGVPKSAEHRKKLSLVNIGKKYVRSAEYRKKLSERSTGHECSPETRKKIGDANRGKKRTLEFCEKVSASRRGYKHSEETKQKMRHPHRFYRRKEKNVV